VLVNILSNISSKIQFFF